MERRAAPLVPWPVQQGRTDPAEASAGGALCSSLCGSGGQMWVVSQGLDEEQSPVLCVRGRLTREPQPGRGAGGPQEQG